MRRAFPLQACKVLKVAKKGYYHNRPKSQKLRVPKSATAQSEGERERENRESEGGRR